MSNLNVKKLLNLFTTVKSQTLKSKLTKLAIDIKWIPITHNYVTKQLDKTYNTITTDTR